MKTAKLAAAVCALTLVLSACNSASADDGSVKLTLAESFPETHVISTNVAQKFIAEVEERSGGKVTFEHYPGEQLGKAGDMLDLLGGAADITFLGPTYLSESLPLSTVATLPGVYPDAIEGGEPFYDMATGILAEEELSKHDAVPLASFVMNQYQLMTSDAAIESTDDVAGLRIRTSGGYQEITAERFGGVPVSMSGPDMYQAFQRGTINASFLTTDSMDPYDLQDVLSFGTDNLSLGGFPGYYAINTSALEGLDAETQQLLQDVGKEVSLEFGEEMKEYQTKIEKEFVDGGFEIYSVPDDVQAEFEEANDDIQQQWADDMDTRDLSGTETLDQFRNLVAEG